LKDRISLFPSKFSQKPANFSHPDSRLTITALSIVAHLRAHTEYQYLAGRGFHRFQREPQPGAGAAVETYPKKR
jgi:hypothetical protein